MRRHLIIGLKALCIPFALSVVILANGKYLSELISIDSNSIFFGLWPFNKVYLEQFAKFVLPRLRDQMVFYGCLMFKSYLVDLPLLEVVF